MRMTPRRARRRVRSSNEEPGEVIAMTKAPEAASAALDVLLTDATDSAGSRFVRPGAAVSVAAGLARRPRRAAHRVGDLGSELAKVVAGRSEIAPAKRDRRFADPAWQSNWM